MTALEIKLLGGLALLIALVLGLHFYDAHQQALGKAQLQAGIDAQHAKDIADASAHNEQIHAAQEATDHEANKFNLQAQLAAPRARSAADGLQQRFAAINGGCVPGDPAASAGGPAASSASDLRADVLRRVAEAALAVASAADGSRGAGQRAEGRYDALTK